MDQKLQIVWLGIKRYMSTQARTYENNGMLVIDTPRGTRFYLAKKTRKMRLKSHLDWAHYTPKTLAQAIDQDQVEAYYETMLKNSNSDPNVWSDHDEEMFMKSFYAARVARATQL